MKIKKVEHCQIEGCKGIASGNLTKVDKETGRELNICAMCYCEISDIPCEKNNCGNPAVNTSNEGEFICKEHERRYDDIF